jgi:hypothetical protein
MKVASAIYPLNVIADALQRSGLGESVLIGTMAAAVHGARVLTDDFDYLVPPCRDLSERIQNMATILGASVHPPPSTRPYGTTMLFVAPANMQIDLLVRMDGIRSFRGLRTRAKVYADLGNTPVATLRDVIRSKRAAGRPKDMAIIPELEATLNEIEQGQRTSTKRR